MLLCFLKAVSCSFDILSCSSIYLLSLTQKDLARVHAFLLREEVVLVAAATAVVELDAHPLHGDESPALVQPSAWALVRCLHANT